MVKAGAKEKKNDHNTKEETKERNYPNKKTTANQKHRHTNRETERFRAKRRGSNLWVFWGYIYCFWNINERKAVYKRRRTMSTTCSSSPLLFELVVVVVVRMM